MSLTLLCACYGLCVCDLVRALLRLTRAQYRRRSSWHGFDISSLVLTGSHIYLCVTLAHCSRIAAINAIDRIMERVS